MFKIEIEIKTQKLIVFKSEHPIREYLISSAKNGVGEKKDSEQTPRGWHIIRAKIGRNQPANTVFVERRPTGEFYSLKLREKFPTRDWILTRILWLSGLELNKNRLHDYDTMRRYIYIHGSPDDVIMGNPGSRGCIRMRNDEIIELFEQVPIYTPVLIKE